MTFFTVAWANLWRNKLRTGLTIGSVAVCVFLFTLLRAVVNSMADVAASSAAELRLVVHQKTTMTKLLPLGHAAKMAAMPGVKAVCAVRWFGGRLENSSAQFPSLAADVASFPTVYTDFNLSADEIEAWRSDRTAAIIGTGLARQMGWSRGQRITLRSSAPPYPVLDFHIVGVTPAQAYPNILVLRLDYLLEALRAGGKLKPEQIDAVHFFWVKADSPAAWDRLRVAIDEMFAQTPDATATEPEEAFVAQFTKMFGDIPRIVGAVGMIVLLSILLVVTNTMSMAIRERIGEVAVLKAIGFSAGRVLLVVLSESTLLGLLGGVLGGAPALLASGGAAEQGINMPYFPVIHVPLLTIGWGVLVGAVIGLVSGVPAAQAVAKSPVTGLLRAAA